MTACAAELAANLALLFIAIGTNGRKMQLNFLDSVLIFDLRIKGKWSNSNGSGTAICHVVIVLLGFFFIASVDGIPSTALPWVVLACHSTLAVCIAT